MKWRIFRDREKKASKYNAEKAFMIAMQPKKTIFSYLKTTENGLSEEEAEERLDHFGENVIARERRDRIPMMFVKTFINPFIGILMVLALVSLVLDVLMSSPENREWATVITISVMVVLSAVLRFTQEWRSNRASDALKKMVKNTASVYRDGKNESIEINISELVPGDKVYLAAGDMVPADLRIVQTKDFFVSQSSLTGESDGVEKISELRNPTTDVQNVPDLEDICFMGTNVVSGSAIGLVFATGKYSYLGTLAKNIVGVRAQTSFDKGINKVSMLLIRFMLVMVPFVFLINGLTKHDWLEAFIFALSVAVGLTPEMLPMIVTSNLAKGAVAMSRHKTIVKNLNAIQNFGAMNILCTDKTGTLTCDKIVLEKYLNVHGENDLRVLRHAYFNSFFQTGLKNLMDQAILSHVKELGFEHLQETYKKVDEIPFDFTRRRMSVIVENLEGKRQIVTKGAIEEMIPICSHVEYDGKVFPMTGKQRTLAFGMSKRMNQEGMRVLAVAQKSWIEKDDFSVEDECAMVLIGYLAFLDPPKSSASGAIYKLRKHGVEVKVLSGDNEAVVKTVCRQVGIDTTHVLSGVGIDYLSDDELKEKASYTTVFSKLTPMQKSRIITALQEVGDNTVGFLGDGINDAAALRQADIGISVDTAADIAKESADIILLDKDLLVLEQGVLEGRKIFGNIMKYIKMTASSNFGNMFSVLAASAFLPFLPMMPIHLLVQNLLYDISQTSIPFDRVDAEYLKYPRKWDASDLSRFMICIGPISSIFDITTYLILWYVFGCQSPDHQALFQSGWFVEGLLSQTLIVHMIRTRKVPFFQSIASRIVLMSTSAIIAIGVAIPYTPFGAAIGLVPIPLSYYPWLAVTLLCYCFLTQMVKQIYIHRFTKWL